MNIFKYFFLALLLHFSVDGFAQTHFVGDYSVNALDHMNINIISATIGGAGLEAGDEIALFDGTICCGVAVLSGPITLVPIDASQKEAGSNGYTSGHVITYKFWDKSEGKERAGITALYLDPVTAIPVTASAYSANESAIVKLSVSAAVNQAPVASSGSDQSVNERVSVTLDGSASSDPDRNPLTYLWTAPAGITLSSTTGSKPTFTAPEVTANTDYTFSLVVSDGTVNSPEDQVVVTVKNVLLAYAGTDQTVNKGVTVMLDGSSSSDPDGKILSYRWTSPAGITLSSTTAAKPTFTAPDVSTKTDYTFSLVVNNGTADSPADQVVISVVASAQGHFIAAFSGYGQDQMTINAVTAMIDGVPLEAGDEIAAFDGPICSGKIILSQSINFNDSHTSAAIVTSRKDAGASNGFTIGNPITYKFWDKSEGRERSGVTAEYLDRNTTLPTTATTYSANESAIVKLSVSAAINHAPVASAGADQSVNEATMVTLDGSGSSDTDGNQLTYRWTVPAGITLNSITSLKPTFTAPEVTVNTNYIFSLLVNDGIVNSLADQVVITVKSALVANAGADQSVNKGASVTLDGSASSDPDGKTLSYKWTSPAGITLRSTTAAKPTFTAPDVSTKTDYTFSLVVNNGTVDSPADQVVISVVDNAQGHFVVAFSGYGQDQMTINAVTAMIDGVPLEVGDEIAAFDGTICCGKIVLLQSINYADFNTSAAIVTSRKDAGSSNGFTVGNPITYKFWDKSEGRERSVVTSEYIDRYNGLSAMVPAYSANESAIVKLSASAIPFAFCGADQFANEGETVTLDGSASTDADGNTLTYKWSAPDEITLSSTNAAKPTFTAPEVTADRVYTISLVVNDGTADSPADQVVITVKNVNKPPVANAATDQSVNEGATVILDGSASTDADGNTLTYKWSAPAEITLSSATVAKLTFTAPEVMADKDYTISLVVNDGTADSPADPVTITVKNVNKVPVANAGTDQSINEGAMLTLDATASTDADGNLLTYKWSAPAGITLSSTTAAKPTFTAPEVMADKDYTISLVVNDGTADSPADQITITVKNVNKVPVANAGTNQSVNEGTTVILDGTASTDADGNPLTYKWSAPAGITLSSMTAAKPTFIAPEVTVNTNYTITLVVNDGTIDSPADPVAITVKNVNKVPVANSGPDQSVNELAMVTLNGAASSDPDGNPVTYKWTAPDGITLSSTTTANPSFISPHVTANTNYTFFLVVNDGILNSPEDQVVITIKQNPPVSPSTNAGTTIAQTSFTANWNKSATAIGYLLDVATNIGFTNFVTGLNNKDIGINTTYFVSGLNAHTTYYYRVRAYNSGGTGMSSNSVEVITLSDPPAAPSGLSASSCNNLVTLKWRKNSDTNFLRYRIYGGLTTNPSLIIDSTSNSISDTTKIISGLTNGQTYYFRITGVNNDGLEGAYSGQSSAVVKTGVIPVIKAKWGDLLICYNLNGLITNYQWYKGSSLIQNAIGQYYSAEKQSGTYLVQTTDKDGCNNSSNTIQITAGTKSLTVYPNPASVSFSLKLKDTSELQSASKEKVIVRLINSAGQKVLELQATNANDELLNAIPVSNLVNGVYIVQVLLNNTDLQYIKIVVIK